MNASNPLIDSASVMVKRCRHGILMYNKHDIYVGKALDLYGEFSEAEVDFFRAAIRPGMTVVDVGANIGCHSVVFAQMVSATGRVIAIEPQRHVFHMLAGNVALNNLGNVSLMHAALGTEHGTLHVPQLNYQAEGNFGGVSLTDNSENGNEAVTVTTLDSLNLSTCHFIKIDVEGAEELVLKGGAEVIRSHKPIIYAENDRPEKSEGLLGQLFSMDYRLYWHTPPMFNNENFFSNTNNVFGDTVSLNVIALPHGTPHRLEGLREIQSADEWPWTVEYQAPRQDS